MNTIDLRHPVSAEVIEQHHNMLASHPTWDALVGRVIQGEVTDDQAILAMIVHFADDLSQEEADRHQINTRRALEVIVGLAFAAREQLALVREIAGALQVLYTGPEEPTPEPATDPEGTLLRAWDEAPGPDKSLPEAGGPGDGGHAVQIALDAEERRYLSDLLNAAPIHLEERLYGRKMDPLWQRLVRPYFLGPAREENRANPFEAIKVRPGALRT